jgi:DNA-directed RNA polymerase specialized sigma24 family protein
MHPSYPILEGRQYGGPANHSVLYQDLKNHKSKAILFLKRRTAALLREKYDSRAVPPEDMEELVNDAVLICLQNIREGACVFQGCSPVAYAVAIGRRLLANFFRKHRGEFLALEGVVIADQHDPLQHYIRMEQGNLLEEYLSRLGATGASVIRLFYFEGFRDDEVVQLQLTPYTTVWALKNKRSQYLKKLREMVLNGQGKFLSL